MRAGERRRGGAPGRVHRWVGVRGAAAGGRGRFEAEAGLGLGVGVGGRCVISIAMLFFIALIAVACIVLLYCCAGWVYMYMDGRMP